LNPAVDESGKRTWFQPTGVGEVNRLMIDLGAGQANAINDLGQLLYCRLGEDKNGTYIIDPTDVDGDGQPDCWFTGVDGFNELATPLGLDGVADISHAGQIAGCQGWSSARLLVPQDTDGHDAADL
jgi:hypothetical protein